ncbi:coumaroyl-CoA:anthocyanidin 3-O-glucoside-6''-O-coumaroyltransferase 2-like [Magnolia sinica]|uniref:coumaroyl-CoA:anthocyanidin 3-O-glucoside-6''-O-coumaroyltransferase 2-like n=1 Tax=Magnolia sinica TaxID=86752 RepID=UPI00265AC75D|nr:coumaroyl-CoA:anthocyanidin 3-O-glucoside-6''-O-coumaroyltransferase 2-like [Magnolia sinica]
MVGNLDNPKRSFLLEQLKVAQSKDASDIKPPTNMVQATFMLSRAQIEWLRNCLSAGYVEAERNKLPKEDGVGPASEAIARAIREFEASGVLKDTAEVWDRLYRTLTRLGDIFVLVGGSPKFQVYETDFRWEKPRKTKMVSINRVGSFYIGDSRDEKSGVKVGLALPEDEIRIFASLFEKGVEVGRGLHPTSPIQ